MPELDLEGLEARVAELRDDLYEVTRPLYEQIERLENAIKAYSVAATTGPHSARESLLDALSK